jgi:hypothetical protein
MLRVMWKLSFIKLDEEENSALKDAVLRMNRDLVTTSMREPGSVFRSEHERVHAEIESRRTPEHSLDIGPFLEAAASGDAIAHEKAIEAALLYYLTRANSETERVFGGWDYVSHQVAASPFKPPDWMDKMDVFGATFIPGYAPSLSRLLVMELKRDVADEQFVQQVMKYVDWVRSEYAHEDYSLIQAFLVAYDFTQAAKDEHQRSIRRYTVGRRPIVSKEWSNLSLVSYRYDPSRRRLRFDVVAAPPS